MKKHESGRVVFGIYGIFLLVMTVIAWTMDEGYIFLANSIATVAVLTAVGLQFSGKEKMVLNGYAISGVVGIMLAAFFLIRAFFPDLRIYSAAMFLASAFVFYHCIHTLMPSGGK